MRVCNEFAERNGYTVIHNYIDRAVSGKTDKREQFQQMLKDSADKSFEFVIVYKLDRFARNRYDSAINKATLKKNGVKVLSACEQITDTPEGIILESMIEGMAEYYSAELSQKVKRGMRESCLKGNAAGIQPIYGYCIVDKKYKIVESEAAIVRKMFADYVSGTTIKELVEWLKISGIRSHRGNVFSFGRVSEIVYRQVQVWRRNLRKYDRADYRRANILQSTRKTYRKRTQGCALESRRKVYFKRQIDMRRVRRTYGRRKRHKQDGRNLYLLQMRRKEKERTKLRVQSD